MAYIGTKPANQVIDSTLIADGTVTPNDLSTGKPVWDTSGNLGVGAAPSSGFGRLQVRNSFAYINEDGADTKQLYIRTNYGGNPAIQVATNDSLVFATNNTERIRIPSNAGGIQFPATQVASSDANTLDDYEEGTWTPAFLAGGISGTSIAYAGTYTKIGRVVTVHFRATSSTDSSNVVISSYAGFSGLPFAVSGLGASGSITTEDIDLFDRNGFCNIGGSNIYLSKCGSASGTNSIYATCTYFTS
jgi:hypothetical protein